MRRTLLTAFLGVIFALQAEAAETQIPRISPWGLGPSQARALSFDDLNLRRTQGLLLEETKTFRQIQKEEEQGRQSITRTRIAQSTLLFDRVIYPKFLSFLRVPLDQAPKISLIFDEFPSHSSVKAYVMREYWNRHQMHAIVMDVSLAGSAGFSVTAFHELQHIFYNHYKGERSSPESDWLNEGLSGFVSLLLSESFPTRWIDQLAMGSKTPALLDWDWEAGHGGADELGREYAYSLLFVAYLYSHFGGDALIRDLIVSPEVGVQSVLTSISRFRTSFAEVPDRFLTFESLFSNFSLALFFNSKRIGDHALFSLSGKEHFLGRLNSFRIGPELVFGGMEGSLEPYQSQYLDLLPGLCLLLEKAEGVAAYIVSEKDKRVRLSTASQEVCSSPNASDRTTLILIRTEAKQTEPGWFRLRVGSNALEQIRPENQRQRLPSG